MTKKETHVSNEDLRKWQLKLFDILLYFKQFCADHGLTFFLVFGSCLGAVRHGGFIPWDDDLDVAMPRKDYEMLPFLWNQYADNSRYALCKTTREENIYFPITLIRDTHTTCIIDHSIDLDICHGLKLDIDPLDYVPRKKRSRLYQAINMKGFLLFNTQRLPNQQSTPIRILAWLLYALIPNQSIRYWIWSRCEREIKKYPHTECDEVRLLGYPCVPKDVFSNAVYIPFEGVDMPVPSGFDKYLNIYYGDYMKLPHVKDRVPKTVIAYYDLDKGYEAYKGIYYCIDDK